MDHLAVKNRLFGCVKTLGFCSWGMADITIGDELDHLHTWLQNGYHAYMQYMASANRGDIAKLFPWAKSALVVAMRVGEPVTFALDAFTAARYAQGRDYHRVMRQRLEQVLSDLSKIGIGMGHICVDTQPILERELARRAGIGWIGKNGMLITPQYGSHVMLGAVLLSEPLPFDSSIAERCGRCTRCLSACPNHALVEPYQLNANRCLSYLTLEHKRSIPIELWPDGHHMLFGCDICQDCCPFNTPRVAYPQRGVAADVADMVGLRSCWDLETMLDMLESNRMDSVRDDRALDRVKTPQLVRNLTMAAITSKHELRRLQKLVLRMYADAVNDNDASMLHDLVMLLADSVQ